MRPSQKRKARDDKNWEEEELKWLVFGWNQQGYDV